MAARPSSSDGSGRPRPRRVLGAAGSARAERKAGTGEPGRDNAGVEQAILTAGLGRTRAEEALQRSEQRLRAMLETAIDAIITIDDRGTMVTVNPATERMFGYSAGELIGKNVKMLMPEPYRSEHDAYIARHLETGEKRIIGIGREVRARRRDGTDFAVDLAVSEVEPRKLFTGIIRDISDRKLAEARVREADRLASIGTLAAGLGHDMNNVLLPVRARLNALLAAAKAERIEEPERKHVEEIRKSVAYLQQLADGLHFLAMDPEKDTGEGVTDLRQWWAQAGALLSKAVPKHVKVSASFPTGLPHAGVPVHGLTQAILNLVVNAGDAIPAERKRRQGHVRILAEPVGHPANAIRLAVTDNGTGMTEEIKRRAFELFFTTKPRGLGTGLGLALVRKVVEGCGGRVEIESQLGKGTTVAMTLPVAASAASRRTTGPSVVISVRDGRASALLCQMLEASGMRASAGGDPSRAAIWIVDPNEMSAAGAEAWRRAHPDGKLVLFGRPAGDARKKWGALGAITVDDRNDLEAVRAMLRSVASNR